MVLWLMYGGGLSKKNPTNYNWKGYSDLFNAVKNNGLKLQVVMSFHTCGGNVGDECNITLPLWATRNGNVYYKDQHGNEQTDYITWAKDNTPIGGGRTPVQIYSDFMKNFASTFSSFLGSTIVEIQVGLGPAGEMRYPSYPLDRWNFPHVGEFQCYDSSMLSDLANYARQAGHPEWGSSGPNNAGNYNSWPDDTGFFNPNCACENFKSPYGQFFLNWYSSRLIDHGDRILSAAKNIFGTRVAIAAKVSGVHWQYFHPSHAAELTAGYKNDQGNGYEPIAKMFGKNNATMIFTCLEMKDTEQPGCGCAPEELVKQTKQSAQRFGLPYSGENALPRYDNTAYSQILSQATNVKLLHAFTYLRLGNTLFDASNWPNFKNFIQNMHNLR